MEIKWSKFSNTMVIGRVGDVECFHIIKEGERVQLVCSLPEATPGCVGRPIEIHTSPKLAAQHAQRLFDHWYIRLTS